MVSVNNPFDLWLAINLMRETPYEKFLVKDLIHRDHSDNTKELRDSQIYEQMLSKYGLDRNKILNTETWRDFDEEFTIKVFKQFKCATAYYNKASCLN